MRVTVRLLATLFALAIAALGVVLVVELVWFLLRPDTTGLLVPWQSMRSTLSQLAWNTVPTLVTAALLTLAGLIVLLSSMRAGRQLIRLRDPAPEVIVTTDRRSLARLVGHQVRDQNGVASARVAAKTRRVRVRVKSLFTQVGELRGRLSTTVDESLRDLPLTKPVRVSVGVKPAKERR